MKLTKQYLKQIINEEISKLSLEAAYPDVPFGAGKVPSRPPPATASNKEMIIRLQKLLSQLKIQLQTAKDNQQRENIKSTIELYEKGIAEFGG